MVVSVRPGRLVLREFVGRPVSVERKARRVRPALRVHLGLPGRMAWTARMVQRGRIARATLWCLG